MRKQHHRVRIPKEFLEKCAETHEDAMWVDDRGVVFGIRWNQELGEPMAAVVFLPQGMSAAEAWFRDLPRQDEQAQADVDVVVQHVVLTFGRAEEAILGSVVFTKHGDGFSTVQEAVEDLAMALLRVHSPGLFGFRRPCCNDTLSAIPDATFCSVCGAALREWEYDGFMEWLRRLPAMTVNELEACSGKTSGWRPWEQFPARERTVVLEEAERVLIEALDPEKLPEECRESIEEWWAWEMKVGRTREKVLSGWNRGDFGLGF